MTFKWNASSNATEYCLEYWGTASGSSCWTSNTNSSKSSLPYGNYTWHVKARNASGESGWSSDWSFVLSPITTGNVIKNPGFENGTANWVFGLPCSNAIISTDAYEGSNYLTASKTTSFPDCLSVWQEYYSTFNVGDTYTFGVWLRSSSGTQTIPIALWFIWYSPTFQSSSSAMDVTIDSTWRCFQRTYQISTTSSRNRLKVEIYLPNIDQSVDIDAFYLGFGTVQYCP